MRETVKGVAMDLLASGLLAVLWTAFSASHIIALIGSLIAISLYCLLRRVYGRRASIVMFLFVAMASVQCVVVQSVLILVWSDS